MNYETAKTTCHVRSAIFRTGDPTKIYTNEDLEKVHDALKKFKINKLGKVVPKIYWKNTIESFDERIPECDKYENDWEEYDPREQEECSSFNEFPA